MKLNFQKYQNENDFWRIRELSRDAFLLNDRLERSWSVPRMDYWFWHYIKNVGTEPMEKVTFLWETLDNELIASAFTIDSEAYVIIHPHYRSFTLENDIFARLEENQNIILGTGKSKLFTLADEDDPLRKDVFESRGYTFRDKPVYRWRRDLDSTLPEIDKPQGYEIRSMGDSSDYEPRSWASWKAFHPGEPDEDYEGGGWYANIQSAPLYRRDLDVVAEAPNGDIAAFSTIFYDETTRSAVCVLVGTAPEYQRLGLGKAVILEGLRRLDQLGGTRVFANGFDQAANALYGSTLGKYYLALSWFKELS